MRRRIAAGNWKMNGVSADLAEVATIGEVAQKADCEVVICLPATILAQVANMGGPDGLKLGGQDCHPEPSGAFTGDISAMMLKDAGAGFVIVGHSERREYHGETNAQIADKACTAWRANLTAIICVGETEAQYRAGQTLDVLTAQVAGSVPNDATPENTILAYEPIWAIGTGLTPTLDEIGAVHRYLRMCLPDANISILYGGSVNPTNASSIVAIEDVDGGLVGGASLNAEKFTPIITALETAR
jgi:triosephosphate isomerase